MVTTLFVLAAISFCFTVFLLMTLLIMDEEIKKKITWGLIITIIFLGGALLLNKYSDVPPNYEKIVTVDGNYVSGDRIARENWKSKNFGEQKEGINLMVTTDIKQMALFFPTGAENFSICEGQVDLDENVIDVQDPSFLGIIFGAKPGCFKPENGKTYIWNFPADRGSLMVNAIRIRVWRPAEIMGFYRTAQ
jgi:hypothetical protein